MDGFLGGRLRLLVVALAVGVLALALAIIAAGAHAATDGQPNAEMKAGSQDLVPKDGQEIVAAPAAEGLEFEDEGSVGVASNHGCPDQRACFWPQANYGGNKVIAGPSHESPPWRVIRCTWVGSVCIAQRFNSAKNFFNARAILMRGPNSSGAWVYRCNDRGQVRPGPLGPGMTEVWIGAVGTWCRDWGF